MKPAHYLGALLACAGASSAPLHAELIDRGGGLIYDTEQDLTWAQDAGLSGSLTWTQAQAWVASLTLGGVSGWRLPTTTQFDDPTCSADVRAAGTYVLFYEHRVDCLGGEMERLTAAHDPWRNSLFINVNRTRYWTATPYRDGIDPCIHYPDYDVPCTLQGDTGDRTGFYWQWGFAHFSTFNGPAFKTTLEQGNPRYAWAVHDGDVGAGLLPGDVNQDMQVDLADYLLLMRFVLGTGPAPTPDQFNAGDLNGNQQLDAGDLIALTHTVLGLN